MERAYLAGLYITLAPQGSDEIEEDEIFEEIPEGFEEDIEEPSDEEIANIPDGIEDSIDIDDVNDFYDYDDEDDL